MGASLSADQSFGVKVVLLLVPIKVEEPRRSSLLVPIRALGLRWPSLCVLTRSRGRAGGSPLIGATLSEGEAEDPRRASTNIRESIVEDDEGWVAPLVMAR